MGIRLISITSLPIVFLVGALATINPTVSIAGITICILGVLVRTRFRSHSSVQPRGGLQPDWIVILLPTALAVRSLSATASLLITGVLVAAAFMRKPHRRFQVQLGPFILLVAASAIVFSRPASTGSMLTFLPLLTFLLVGTLVARLVMTVDARKIIAGLIDGCGLYLLANVLCHTAGLESPASNARIGGLVESTGFVRTIYPLTLSINTPPIIAAIYVAAIIFLVHDSGWVRRSLRLICLVAAIIVLIGAGTRAPMIDAAVISIIVVSVPYVCRWLGQITTILTAISAFVLPSIVASAQSGLAPLVSLAPGRASGAGSVGSIGGREYIWDDAIKYWIDRINTLPHVLFGFGVNGQYRSGASLSYSDGLSSIIRNPETAFVHNSFLQQLFDGGLAGWILLAIAICWSSAMLAKRQRDWGNRGLIAIVAMAVLLLSGISEVSLAPGAAQETFWLLLILIGVSCQASGAQAGSSYLPDGGDDATATHESENAQNVGIRRSEHGLQSTYSIDFTLDRWPLRNTFSAKSVSN